MLVWCIILVCIFAVLYRLRGGAISVITNKLFGKTIGTISTRLICWVLPITLLYFLSGYEPVIVGLVFLTTWAGISMGHGTFQDDGTEVQTFNWFAPFMPLYSMNWPRWTRITIDAIGMGIVNAVRGVLIIAPILFLSKNPLAWQNLCLVLPLLATGIAYFIGWRIPISLPEVREKSTEWGELLTGALYGLGFYLSLFG